MKFLICSDGSKQAERAVRFGGMIAAACQAEVTLFGIVEEAPTEDDLFHALRRNQQVLKELHVPVELITRSGEPVSEILKQTMQMAYDLVIIGAVRKGTQGAYWMSAKAYKLIKGAPVPVLVVIGGTAELKRILICSGGAAYINKAVRFAGKVAQCVQASATLVHVFAQPPALYADMLARMENVDNLLNSNSELGRNLREQREILQGLGVEVEVKLPHGPVIWGLLNEIRGGRYDLVVVGFAPSGRPFQSFIMGDLARELVNRAECPILVVRGDEGEKEPGIAGVRARLRKAFGGMD